MGGGGDWVCVVGSLDLDPIFHNKKTYRIGHGQQDNTVFFLSNPILLIFKYFYSTRCVICPLNFIDMQNNSLYLNIYQNIDWCGENLK